MFGSVGRLVRARGLVATLTVRELKARYRGSVLGFCWSLVNPLLLLSVYALVFGLVLGRSGTTEPYVLFLISGLFPWIWASSSLLEGTVSLTANGGLLRKALFPVEVLPMVSVLANLVHFLLALPIVAAALLVGRAAGYAVGGAVSPLVVAVIALELVLLAGLTLGLAALNVHFKDARDLLSNLLTLLFFLQPIIYPLAAVPGRPLRLVVASNPFTPFTLAYQELLFAGRLPAPVLWLEMLAVASVGFACGSFLFSRLSETLVEAV